MPRGQTVARAQQPVVGPELWNFADPSEHGKILAFSGKMGAGKDSCSRFLYSLAMMSSLNFTPEAEVRDDGKLYIYDVDGMHEFNEDSRHPEVMYRLAESVWPFIRKFSCASKLKEFLHDVLQVQEKYLWGTSEEKNEPTHLKWEDMPTAVGILSSKKGFMSGREVMEYFGTSIVRHVYPKAWAQALAKEIVEYNSAYSLVSDVRFVDEAEEIHRIGGKIIRLTRITPEAAANNHVSNTALDDWDGFDYVLNNNDYTLEETFAELLQVLTSWNWFAVVNQ